MAHLVWPRFGDVANYVEAFAGSLAVLLARPTEPGIETVNDLDCHIANFWRAIQADPDGVAKWADWPVSEPDLHARHLWLVNRVEWRERMKTEPEFYDVKIAGWWLWGICQWIGGGWCAGAVHNKLPHLGDAGRGVHRKRRALGGVGSGVGVHSKSTRDNLLEYMSALAARLRRVRVCCGDWSRVTGPSVTFGHGLTGVFLDPPYSAEAGRDEQLYAEESLTVAHDVRAWAIEQGSNPLMRLALCGYANEHAMPDDWECVPWKSNGGYGSQHDGAGRENSHRERIWFSPHCLKIVKEQKELAL